MIIHIIIPKQRLIPIPPKEVLRSDVLIRVLNAFFQGRHVGPVLPVLDPEIVGVDAAEDEGGDYDAGDVRLCIWCR